MPEISNKITYSPAAEALIRSKETQIGTSFNYTDWSNDDLQELRKEIRDFYKFEQRGICAFCRNSVSMTSTLNCHIEHIVPKSKHIAFIFEPKNLCVVCAECNTIKKEQETLSTIEDTLTLSKGKARKKYPTVSTAFKIVHPHFDRYQDHIIRLGDYYYVDRTKKGNFTIGACRLNRMLHEFGWQETFHDDNELVELMNTYLETNDSLERRRILRKLTTIGLEASQE